MKRLITPLIILITLLASSSISPGSPEPEKNQENTPAHDPYEGGDLGNRPKVIQVRTCFVIPEINQVSPWSEWKTIRVYDNQYQLDEDLQSFIDAAIDAEKTDFIEFREADFDPKTDGINA